MFFVTTTPISPIFGGSESTICYDGYNDNNLFQQMLDVTSTSFCAQLQSLSKLLHNSHTASQTQDWLTQNCSDFLRKEEIPPNIPEINPIDFYILGAMLHQYEQSNPKPKPAKIS